MRFIAFLVASLACVSVARAEWIPRHPLPQGLNLNDVVFLDDATAIAVGEDATVLVSVDGGLSWSTEFEILGLHSALNAIDRVSSTSAVAVGEDGVIVRTDDKGTTWQALASGQTGPLTDVSFGDALHGCVCAEQMILRTSDGGQSWLPSYSSSAILSLDMISATEVFAGTQGGPVLHSMNGGMSWSNLVRPAPATSSTSFTAIDFVDALHGAVAGQNGPAPNGPIETWYRTADGGATWTAVSTVAVYGNNSFYMPTELLYGPNGLLMATWKVECCAGSANDPPPGGEFIAQVGPNSVNLINSPTGQIARGMARNSSGVIIVVGDNGMMSRGDAGGVTRMGAPAGDNEGPFASSFVDEFNGVVTSSYNFVGGETHVAHTNDGGLSWTDNVIENANVRDVAHTSSNEVYAVGVNPKYMQIPDGIVLRSMNGGSTWSQIWASPSLIPNAVAAGSSTHAIAVGSSDQALIIDNGIVTLAPLGMSGYWVDVAFASPSVAVAVGPDVLQTTDGGQYWIRDHYTGPPITRVAFSTSTTGFGVTAKGLMRTDTAGQTWDVVDGAALTDLVDIDFADEMHGMAVGLEGVTTVDGGNTWVPIQLPTTRGFNRVHMVTPNKAFVSGYYENLFEYDANPTPTLIRTLDVTAVPFGAVLRWDVVTDEHLSGFSVIRSNGATRETIASSLAVTSRSFHDEGRTPGKTYEYQLIAVDHDGSYTQSMPVRVTIPTAAIELMPNQPNPFNPETTIRFVVPEQMRVTLSVHDVAGRVVATLVDDVREPGMHTITWNAQGVASGVYFAKLRAGKTEVSRKMVLLK